MKKQKYKSGIAHLAVMIIVTLLIIGGLGYVCFQSFSQNKKAADNKSVDQKEISDEKNDTSKTKEESDAAEPEIDELKEKTYSGDLFSFDYPETGWTIKNDMFNGNETKGYVSLETDDYKSGPMGPEQGSTIGIGEFELEGFASIKSLVDYYYGKGLISNLSETKVDGQTAYKYLFGYENTLFEKNGKYYHVALSGQIEENLDVYDDVLSTLKVK